MQTRRLLPIVLATAVLPLSACAVRSDTCTAAQSETYVKAVSPIVDQFDALLAESETADFETRDTYLDAMRELRQQAQDLDVPACAQSELDWYLSRMDTGIEGLAALQDITPTPVPPTPTPLPPTATPVPLQEVEVIELDGGLSRPEVEVSGLAWHGDTLIVLPQRPSQEGGVLYALDKADILAYLDGTATEPLTPRNIRFTAPNLVADVVDFDGFEAIAFDGDDVYMLIESEQERGMFSYLAAGIIDADETEVLLDTATLAEIQAQSIVPEAAEETLLIVGNRLLTIYEVNASRSTPTPMAHAFTVALQPDGTLPFPNVDWRITDATEIDGENRFWVVNTSFLALSSESLIEFQYAESGITRTERQSIPLLLETKPRNWEGIVRLDDRGFLIATDLDPGTILAFVAMP
jgi:hypothetical protein